MIKYLLQYNNMLPPLNNKMPLTQTPFEKAMTRRTGKAREILDLISSNNNYTDNGDLTSCQALGNDLDLFSKKSDIYFDLIGNYLEISLIRKSLFYGQEQSIKEISIKIRDNLTKALPPSSNQRKNVRAIQGRIQAQNPLSPPFDFSKRTFDREMINFEKSYITLINQFKLLIVAAEECLYIPDSPEFTIDKCRSLIQSSQALSLKIDAELQRIYILHDERTLLFDKIKERCIAIYNRCRFLFGSYDQTFLEVYRLKSLLL